MKYLKKFEDKEYFDVGDYIKCITKNDFQKGISIGSVYKIKDFKSQNSNIIYVVIDNDLNKIGWYKLLDFIEATPEEIKKYHIDKDENKYNL